MIFIFIDVGNETLSIVGILIGTPIFVSAFSAIIIKNKKDAKLLLEKCDSYNGEMDGNECHITTISEEECEAIGGTFENDICTL